MEMKRWAALRGDLSSDSGCSYWDLSRTTVLGESRGSLLCWELLDPCGTGLNAGVWYAHLSLQQLLCWIGGPAPELVRGRGQKELCQDLYHSSLPLPGGSRGRRRKGGLGGQGVMGVDQKAVRGTGVMRCLRSFICFYICCYCVWHVVL